MKAIIYHSHKSDEGKCYPMLGSGHITGNYKTEANLIRYAVEPYFNRKQIPLIIEVYYNWDNRYAPADKIILFPRRQ